MGFQLLRELGRGAFGRVFLAKQGPLSGRLVALKVAYDIAGESRTLAQLQHTNIVPIYSFHRTENLQAVCMPYFGGTTLAHVLQHLSDRPTLPSSGRELKSTLNRRTTEPSPNCPRPQISGSAPALPSLEALPMSPGSDPAGWARLEGLSYVGAVLWLGEQLADGLAHAHARGILHRDLKPANVLLADDGRPMLLDFNLAEDTKLRNGSAERAAIGGTLPFMSPEQLAGFFLQTGRLDERSDIYSLGVILFELLTGQRPYPIRSGSPRDMIPQMLADRKEPLNSPSSLNRAVSPAVDAIIRKCLAVNPGDRYQVAAELREDLDRQLNNLPLKYAGNPSTRERVRKWFLRHPKLTSSGSVAVVAILMIAGLGIGIVQSRAKAREFHAMTQFADHRTGFKEVQSFLDDRNRSYSSLDSSLEKLRGVLSRYRVPEDGMDDSWLAGSDVAALPADKFAQLRGDMGETYYQMAEVACRKATGSPGQHKAQLSLATRWHAAAVRHAADRLPRAILAQEAKIARLSGDLDATARLQTEASARGATSARDSFMLGASLAQNGEQRAALPHLEHATQLDPTDHSGWFVRGTVHLYLGENELAAECFTACLALRPDFAPAWLDRGVAYSRRRFYKEAIADFDRAIQLDHTLAKAYVARAEVRERQREWKAAEADYTAAIEGGAPEVRLYFSRATVREKLQDRAGAQADREHGFSLKPYDEMSWVARGLARLEKDAKGALEDAEQALKMNPACVDALQLKAHILAERLNRPDEAEKALDLAVELNSDYVLARAGRGVLLARHGKRDEAIRDAREALRRDTFPPNLYQVGCIYALTSALDKGHPEDKREAFRLLFAALRTGFGLNMVDTDRDLDPIRKDEEFKRMVAGARSFFEASKR
ncbi:MAG TPA: serine/threonine-protein kinase [Gemmata sp.]|nr:serine/threonine-protein kinase [Gemmata sp.]